MARLVRASGIASDSWQSLESREAIDRLRADGQRAAGALVPLPLWLASRDALSQIGTPLGVRLEPHDDPRELVPDLARIELIAVNFPRFSDGRGYSIARILRGRHGFRGELRAVGDVLIDQLYYLQRVGFDAFALRDDQDPAAAAAALQAFSVAYQGASDEPRPLFRRRLESA